jgi:hypothetical protein
VWGGHSCPPNVAKQFHEIRKIVFWIAGIWGVLVLTPLYFMFDMIGRQDPPAITHPSGERSVIDNQKATAYNSSHG